MKVYALVTDDGKHLGSYSNLMFLNVDEKGNHHSGTLETSNVLVFDNNLYKIAGSFQNSFTMDLPGIHVGIREDNEILEQYQFTEFVNNLCSISNKNQYNLCASQLKHFIASIVTNMPDSDVIKYSCLLPQWSKLCQYKTGNTVRFGEDINTRPCVFRVIKDHKAIKIPAQDNLNYQRIGIDDKGISVWVPPTQIGDSYSIDNIVSYDSNIYKSLVSNNFVVPIDTEYWKLLNEEEYPKTNILFK